MARLRAGFPWVGKAFQESAASTRSMLLSPARYRAFLEDVVAPTLVTWGTHDPVVAPAAIEAIARSRPEWDNARFDGVGHVPQLEAPEQFIETVSAWMAQVSVAGPG